MLTLTEGTVEKLTQQGVDILELTETKGLIRISSLNELIRVIKLCEEYEGASEIIAIAIPIQEE